MNRIPETGVKEALRWRHGPWPKICIDGCKANSPRSELLLHAMQSHTDRIDFEAESKHKHVTAHLAAITQGPTPPGRDHARANTN